MLRDLVCAMAAVRADETLKHLGNEAANARVLSFLSGIDEGNIPWKLALAPILGQALDEPAKFKMVLGLAGCDEKRYERILGALLEVPEPAKGISRVGRFFLSVCDPGVRRVCLGIIIREKAYLKWVLRTLCVSQWKPLLRVATPEQLRQIAFPEWWTPEPEMLLTLTGILALCFRDTGLGEKMRASLEVLSPERLLQILVELPRKTISSVLELSTMAQYNAFWDVFATSLERWGDPEFDAMRSSTITWDEIAAVWRAKSHDLPSFVYALFRAYFESEASVLRAAESDEECSTCHGKGAIPRINRRQPAGKHCEGCWRAMVKDARS